MTSPVSVEFCGYAVGQRTLSLVRMAAHSHPTFVSDALKLIGEASLLKGLEHGELEKAKSQTSLYELPELDIRC